MELVMEAVSLEFATDRQVILEELCGRQEQAVSGASTAVALRLLDDLMAPRGGEALRAAALAAPDRDRLLAAVYRRTYGPRIESTVHCSGCGEPFDLDFTLADLEATLAAEGQQARSEDKPGGEGGLRSSGGWRFRLPTGEDEQAVRDLPSAEAREALLERCLLDEPSAEKAAEVLAEVEAAMEASAPVLGLDLDADCPECGTLHKIHFDIQHYLLSALERERSRLAQEIHRLASAYGWSLEEILGLPRRQRRALVALVEDELPIRRRGR